MEDKPTFIVHHLLTPEEDEYLREQMRLTVETCRRLHRLESETTGCRLDAYKAREAD